MPSSRRSDRRPTVPLAAEFLTQRSLAETDTSSLPKIEVKSLSWHAHLFRKRLGSFAPQARHGDLVRLVDGDGKPVGFGYFNPRAEISVRILTRSDRSLNDDWWNDRLRAAVDHRRRFLKLDETTNAYRLIHGEGDGVPGMVVDRFSDILVGEAFTLCMYQRSKDLMERLQRLTGTRHWLVRPGPNTVAQEGFEAASHGSQEVPEQTTIRENGIEYEVDLLGGHKTGFFCDQRENRSRLATWAQPGRLLDLCCYTGGFSLSASQVELVTEVTGVDLDEEAVTVARRNAKRNKSNVRFVHADAFGYMRDMIRNGKQYETVVLDPPKLIAGRKEIDAGRRKYFDFNRLALQLVAPGGLLLTCSCSGLLSAEAFQQTVCSATPEGRSLQILDRSGAGADHPIAGDCPELEYLKALWVRVT